MSDSQDTRHMNENPDFPELTQVLRDNPGPLASPELKARILADFDQKAGPSLLEALWPFGNVWRPAAGLIAAAFFGVYLGLNVDYTTLQVADADALFAEEAVILGQGDAVEIGATGLEDF